MPKNTWDEYSLSMHPQPFNKGTLQPEKPFMMSPLGLPICLGAPISQTGVRDTNHNSAGLVQSSSDGRLSIVIDWYRLGHI